MDEKRIKTLYLQKTFKIKTICVKVTVSIQK